MHWVLVAPVGDKNHPELKLRPGLMFKATDCLTRQTAYYGNSRSSAYTSSVLKSRAKSAEPSGAIPLH